MTLKLLPKHLQTIHTHSESIYPQECCGIILGNLANTNKTVVEILPTENAWHTQAAEFSEDDITYNRRERYAIAPQAMLQAQKDARDRQLKIIGIYHSHPDNPAIPSEFDRLYAWQEYSYIIVSVQNGKAGDLKSWCLDDNHQFKEEAVESGEWGVGSGE